MGSQDDISYADRVGLVAIGIKNNLFSIICHVMKFTEYQRNECGVIGGVEVVGEDCLGLSEVKIKDGAGWLGEEG